MHDVVAGAGGVPPATPPPLPGLALTGAEREEISRWLANGVSLRAVSRRLGRAASTVSREVRRHGGRRVYPCVRCRHAGVGADVAAEVCRLATRPALCEAVAAKLALDWAPQQIAGWLRHAYPDDPEMHVSHETIYLSLFVQVAAC
jgi:Transposase and inactivated derivatives, IS30 family